MCAQNETSSAFLASCIAFQNTNGGDIYAETDTDTDNASLPAHRRWVWYCKLRSCPGYYRAWSLKTNFLLHLAETPVHRDDPATKTRKGRQQLAEAWKEETAFDLKEPKKRSPEKEAENAEALRQLTGDAAIWADFFAQDTSGMRTFKESTTRSVGRGYKGGDQTKLPEGTARKR